MNLVLIYGPPAAGKLTVARELATLTGYTVFDNHTMLDSLLVLFPRSKPELEPVRTELGRQWRLTLFKAAAVNGINLITTYAPIAEGRHEFVRTIIKAVESGGGRVRLVQLLPPQDVLEDRVVHESRKGVKADTVKRLRELIADSPGMMEPFPDTEHLQIDNSTTSATEVARKIIKHYDL